MFDYDLPETWAGKMEALTAGVVDFDDWEPLAMECADIADQAVRAHITKAEALGQPRVAMHYMVVMPHLLNHLLKMTTQEKRDEREWGALCNEINHCGEVADAVLAGTVDVM